MELKPGYKQTAVGVIPEDWGVISIGKACRLINGRGFKPHEWENSGLPIIRIQNLNGSNEYNYFSGDYDSKIEVHKGQLLFAWSESRGTSFGPHIWHGPKALLNYHTWKVAINEKVLEPDYFYHALKKLTAFIEDKAHGASALVHTQKWEMEKFPIAVPTCTLEQADIANALSSCDKLLSDLEALLRKKRNIKQAAMQELLTGKRRLPGFEGEWEVKKLGDIAEITMGQSPSSYNYNKQGRGLPLIQGNADIKNRETVPRVFTTQITKRGFNGDILMTVRAPVGEVSRANIDVCLGRGVCAICFRSDFLYHFLVFLEPAWAKHSKGSTFDSVNAADIKAVDVHLPCDSLEQDAIAESLGEMDAELTVLEIRLAKAHAIKQGMLQQLLTGKIRLT